LFKELYSFKFKQKKLYKIPTGRGPREQDLLEIYLDPKSHDAHIVPLLDGLRQFKKNGAEKGGEVLSREAKGFLKDRQSVERR
jgi:hypothetical protein